MIEALLGTIATTIIGFGSFLSWQVWQGVKSIAHMEGRLDHHEYRITQLEKDSP